MATSKAEFELKSALLGTGVVSPVSAVSKGGNLEVLCRQVPLREKAVIQMLTEVLTTAEKEAINLHVCKRFILKDGKLAFGWNFALDCKSAKAALVAVEVISKRLVEIQPDLVVAEQALLPEPEPAPAPVRPATQSTPDAATLRRRGIAVHTEAGIIGNVTERRGSLQRGVATEGRLTITQQDSGGTVFEMPLPHVRREMNVPNERGRGAVGSNGNFSPARRR